MTISTELANFRTDNWCDINQLPDTVWLRYYNNSRDILIDRITAEQEDYFYNEIKTNIIDWQREYTIPKRWDLDSNNNPMDWLQKIKGISIKFKDTDIKYSKLSPNVLENKDNDLQSYSDTSSPFYVVSDNSYFLYPTPTENIINWVIIYWIMYPKELALTDSETLPDRIKKAILLWVAERFFSSQKMYQEAQIAWAKFVAEINRVAITLSWRIQAPTQITTPNLNHLA